MNEQNTEALINNAWEPIPERFIEWLNGKEDILNPGLSAEPSMKVLIFLALLEANNPCTYEDLRKCFQKKNIIKGNIPDNTLRTSVLNLGKTLEKFSHPLQLKSLRGRFQLIPRINKNLKENIKQNQGVLLLEPTAVQAEDVAITLIEKAMLPLPGLYFLEWSARLWEAYSGKEAEIRANYEIGAWNALGIKDRLINDKKNLIGIVSLAPGEGLAELGLLKKILNENDLIIHYLTIDSSPKLLRDHIGLIKESFGNEIENGRLIFAGIVGDVFKGLREMIERARTELTNQGIIKNRQDFLPLNNGLLVTYFGNCLGNNNQDQESEFFSMIYRTFQNRPLEVLVGVSSMRSAPDQYIRNWDDFLLQCPKYLLETKKFLISHKENKEEPPEFVLSDDNRCPPVKPEPYVARHQIKGQIYRFYYKLAYDLDLATSLAEQSRPLPRGTLILLHSIIKYDMKTLVSGIEKSGLFNVKYLPHYHQLVDTANGKREYAVFSAFVEK